MEEVSVALNPKVVIIGGSAGSIEILVKVLPRINSLGGAALVLVLHRKKDEDSKLEELLAVKSLVPVVAIEDKSQLKAGNIYIAPADYHLLFEKDGTMSLDISEKINYSRPSIDVSFESAAEVYGPALTGILLSGSNADGTVGLEAIRNHDGIVIVQDPTTAEMAIMPQSAIAHLIPDHIFNIEEIIKFLKGVGC